MQISKYIKRILYVISQNHKVTMITFETYKDVKYSRTIKIKIDDESEEFRNQYELLDWLQGYLKGDD